MTTTAHDQKRFRILISDREYKSWRWIRDGTDSNITPPPLAESDQLINPLHLKLFSGDLVDLSTPIPTILHSPTRLNQIPGILILEGGQTYGRTSNNKRLFYKCVPNDRYLPAFLVPYQPAIDFAKVQKNRFVVFRFDNWSQKHPHGILVENLGTVDDLASFYEYQLYCRSIYTSIAEFNRAAKKTATTAPDMRAVKLRFSLKTPASRPPPRIFSIDPKGSTDFDDAFSVSLTGHPSRVAVCVYIANVYVWLETMNLWKSFSNRVSTIYLPDFKRPMMPTILSESICSLTADGKEHAAFCMEVQVDLELGKILPNTIKFQNKSIVVGRNFEYESPELLDNMDYQLLSRCAQRIDSSVEDSHDVVAHWMIQMNQICGDLLNKRGRGIFRQTINAESSSADIPLIDTLPDTLTANTKRLITNWKHTTGQYVAFDPLAKSVHATMKTESYVHITSPIRRLVDLMNLIIFQCEFEMIPPISADAAEFLEKWLNDLPYINTTMRSVRKVQIDCDVLRRCTAHPEWMQHPHPGVVFDRVKRTDGLYSYMVHITDLREDRNSVSSVRSASRKDGGVNILSRLTSQEKYDNYQTLPFRIFVFEDEDKVQRKIRIAVD